MPLSEEQAQYVQSRIEQCSQELKDLRAVLHRYERLIGDDKQDYTVEVEGVLLRSVDVLDRFTADIYNVASEAIDTTRTLDERRRWREFLRDRW